MGNCLACLRTHGKLTHGRLRSTSQGYSTNSTFPLRWHPRRSQRPTQRYACHSNHVGDRLTPPVHRHFLRLHLSRTHLCPRGNPGIGKSLRWTSKTITPREPRPKPGTAKCNPTQRDLLENQRRNRSTHHRLPHSIF